MSAGPEKLIPAYIPWETFTNFLSHLKTTAVPSRVDKSAMPPGTPRLTGGQIQSALKFFRLTDAAGNTLDALNALVSAFDTEKWRQAICDVIQGPYGDIIGDLDIRVATQHQLDERFKAVGVVGQMLSKSVRFYLAALSQAGISCSPHLTARRKPSRPARKKASGGKSSAVKANDNNGKEAANRESATTPIPKDPPGTQRYPLYFRGKPDGSLVVPANLTAADCKVIELQLAVLKAYVEGEEK